MGAAGTHLIDLDFLLVSRAEMIWDGASEIISVADNWRPPSE